ncbi:hypothetical protein V2J09_018736 [Rumex salicifolius]
MSSGWNPFSTIWEKSSRARSADPCMANPDIIAFHEDKVLVSKVSKTCLAAFTSPHLEYMSIRLVLRRLSWVSVNVNMDPFSKIKSTEMSTGWENAQQVRRTWAQAERTVKNVLALGKTSSLCISSKRDNDCSNKPHFAYPAIIAFHATTSLLGISSNSLRASSNKPFIANPVIKVVKETASRRGLLSNTLRALSSSPPWQYILINEVCTKESRPNPSFNICP